jgi:hypothetical protein
MKKIVINEIDKLYSKLHSDRFIIEYIIYLIENDIFNIPENSTTYKYVNFIKNTLRNIISLILHRIIHASCMLVGTN